MKSLMCVIAALVAAGAYAQAFRPMSEAALKTTGGFVMCPGSQKGEITYVNCQTEAKDSWILSSIAYFTKETRFRITLKTGKFNFSKPEIQGEASLFIINDPAMPVLLAAPENRWVAVNVAPLKTDKEPFFEARVKKELTRGFAYLCGAANSQYPGALTGPVLKAEDLDTHVDSRLPVDVLARFQKSMPAFGVKPALYTTYRSACQQGWAAAPTNDYQKAIWEKAREVPTKPIKVEFDPKKGE